jgi:hypothetical protein
MVELAVVHHQYSTMDHLIHEKRVKSLIYREEEKNNTNNQSIIFIIFI